MGAKRHIVQLIVVTSEPGMTQEQIMKEITQGLNMRRVFLESALIDEVKE